MITGKPLSPGKYVFNWLQKLFYLFQRGRNVIRWVRRSCLLLSHSRNIASLLNKLRSICHMQAMFFSLCGINAMVAAWQMCSPCVTKEIRLGNDGRSAPPSAGNHLIVLQEKWNFGHVVQMFLSCCERNVTSATW